MTVVDTSVLVPAYLSGHGRHEEALARLSGNVELHVPTAVLAEASQVLRRIANGLGEDGNRFARSCIEHLVGLPGFRHAPTRDATGAVRRYLADPALSFADACCLELARRYGIITFDERLARQAGQRA